MIRALRRRHLAVWLALALLLPLILIAAVGARSARHRAKAGEIPAALEPFAKPADDVSSAGR